MREEFALGGDELEERVHALEREGRARPDADAGRDVDVVKVREPPTHHTVERRGGLQQQRAALEELERFEASALDHCDAAQRFELELVVEQASIVGTGLRGGGLRAERTRSLQPVLDVGPALLGRAESELSPRRADSPGRTAGCA